MVRGTMRGRGRGMGRGGMKLRPPFIPHVTFDIFLAEPAFPPVKQTPPANEEPFQAVSHSYSNDQTINAHTGDGVIPSKTL
jgi:hypothetical protein